MNRKYYYFVVIVCVLVFSVWYLIASSDRRKINRVFTRVSEQVEKKHGEPFLVSATKAQALAALVANEFSFSAPEIGAKGTLSSEKVASVVNLVRSQESGITAHFENLSIAFPEKNVADVNGDVFFNGETHNFGFPRGVDRKVKARLLKDADSRHWRFSDVEIVK